MKLSLTDFDYQLPTENIAQTPATPRDQSRLLHLDRKRNSLTHYHFHQLASILRPTDVIVRNNTKVIPARIVGHKTTGGKVEVLLVQRRQLSAKEEVWDCLTKPGIKPEQSISFTQKLHATCLKADGYLRQLRFNLAGPTLFEALEKNGQTPLPPYISWSPEDEPQLRKLYQTTYAKIAGSAAAPTAGLHFTSELDQKLLNKGIKIEEVTLHVGLGTFLPIKTDDVAQHHMHHEWFKLSATTADRLRRYKQEGRRLIAVGTTTCRVLETCSDLKPQSGETNIYIYPPYQFKVVDGLITNFHLPQSSLVVLVAAFCSTPNTAHQFTTFENSSVGRAYQTAIAEKYRFYSFGDAMLIT